jgi:SOS-response transcriptional repressor LexA
VATELSSRQEEVLDVLRRMIAAHGHPPTTRELAAELGVNPSAVHGSLLRLRALGRVTWEDGRARTLRVVDDDEGGRIAG